MSELQIAWTVAALAGVATVALWLRVATEGRRTAALRDRLQDLEKQAKSARKHDEKRDKALRRLEADLDKATHKLGQADKHRSQARDAARAERDAAKEEIRGFESRLAESRTALDGANADLESARHELELATRRVVEAEARAEAAESRAASAPPPADPEELRVLRERVDSAEQKLSERDDALAAATREVQRLKEKVATQETLYTSIRSELSVKKDQIRQQREELERLQSIRVAVAPGSDEP